MAVNQALMIEGAAHRIFNPLGIEAAAGVGSVPGSAKAAHGKCLRRLLAQWRNIRFHGDVCAGICRAAHRQRQIDLTFHQLKTQPLQRVQPDGVAGGDLRLHSRPPRQRLRRQPRRVLVKAHDRAVHGKEAVLPLQGVNTGADGHGADPADIGRSRFFPAASPHV